MSASSTNTLGRYQIIREIARSNDIVYEAIDPTINRRIALKELSIPPNVQGAARRERIERFWREGKAAGRLSHPNIVTIFEVGKDGDRHFIAMEYLEGQTLRDVLQSGGPISIKTAIDYALQLCSALSYAHRNGVVHRDIKPENVQVLPGGHIKLTDFGIARLMGEPSITQDGQVFGTPSYMSPEQVAGKDLDSRSDIFSIGVLMYEMIAGKKPFAGDSIVTITYNIVNMEPTPPPGAPPYLVNIIRKAMSKDVNARYQSIDDLVEDIKEQKSDEAFTLDPANVSMYPSPFGGAAQGPVQQPSVPITPYGTPIPSAGAGGPQNYAPDPFASPAPVIPSASPKPAKPLISAETRNFLGVFLLVIGIAGMVVFAIWAVNLAFQSYVTAQTSGASARYYEQGKKLYESGQYDAAEVQYKNAIRISPRSKAAESAKDGLYKVWIVRAYKYSNSGDKDNLMRVSKVMVEQNPDAPEGHYYLGLAHELSGDMNVAEDEYNKISRLAGNDEQGYGKASRDRLDRINRSKTSNSNSAFSAQQQTSEPKPSGDDSGIPFDSGQ